MKKVINNFLIGFGIILMLLVVDVAAELTLPQQSYTVELPTNSDNDNGRQQDFIKALTIVLTRNSNDPKVLELEGVKVALNKPGIYVRCYNYINRGTIGGKQELFIQVSFDPKAITKLLQRSSKVVWVGAKPSVLVWLTVDKLGGKVLDEASDDGIIDILKKKALEFSISIILPTLDLQDLSNIKVRDICNLDEKKIKTASQRYGSAAIVVGCISSPSILKSEWSGKWLFLQGAKSDNFTFTGTSHEDVIAQAMKKIGTNTISVSAPVVGKIEKVALRITNIDGLNQYHEVAQYLHTLGRVTQIDLVNIGALEVELSINIFGGKQALLTALSAQNRLMPNEEAKASTPGIDLDYKWNN